MMFDLSQQLRHHLLGHHAQAQVSAGIKQILILYDSNPANVHEMCWLKINLEQYTNITTLHALKLL